MYRTSLSGWRQTGSLPPSQGSSFTEPAERTTEIDCTGVITEISNAFSLVSITIDTSQREFYFSKGLFYTFGVKCDGDMDNILEKGMEVNLTYVVNSKSKTYIIKAVWIGGKPDSLSNTSSLLSAIYAQKGRVSSVAPDGFSFCVELDESQHSVEVNKAVVFREGYRLDEKSLAITVGEIVTLDAIPIKYNVDEGKRQLPSNSKCRYMATCCWIGTKQPRIVDRLHVRKMDEEMAFMKREDMFHGIVSLVPNEVMAIVDVEGKDNKVILFRSSFREYSLRIGDKVAVGDFLCLRLHPGCVLPGRWEWLVTHAWKDGVEVSADKKDIQCIKDQMADIYRSEYKLGDHDSCCVDVSHVTGTIGNVDSSGGDDFRMASKETAEVASHDSSDGDSVYEMALSEVSPFYAKDENAVTSISVEEAGKDVSQKSDVKFTKTSLVLFNYPPLTGIIQQISFDSAIIRFGNLNVFVVSTAVFVHGNVCSSQQFRDLISPGDNAVNFEAVLAQQSNTVIRIPNKKNQKFTHVATCVWLGEKPSIKDVMLSSLPPPNFSIVEDPNRRFRGLVSKFCLPRIALIHLTEENTTVCLHVSSFGENPKPLNEYASGKGCINSFVKLNDCVEFSVKAVTDISIIEAVDVMVKKKEKTEIKKKTRTGSVKMTLRSSKPVIKSDSGSDVLTAPFVGLPAVFIKAWPTKRREFLLDFSGALHFHDSNGIVTVKCDLGHSSPIQYPVIYGFNNDEHKDVRIDYSLNGREIRFDADVMAESSVGYGYFFVKRIWAPGNNRPSAELSLVAELSCKGSKPILKSQMYHGVIKSVPYHDCALAKVCDSVVLVPLESLATAYFNVCYETIDMFLGVGDSVGLKIEETSYGDKSGGSFLKAVQCVRLIKSARKGSTEDQNTSLLKVDTPRLKFWEDLWGSGKFYRTSPLVRSKGCYTVEYKILPSNRTTLGITIKFTLGSVFVDGVQSGPETLGELEGREVTFHVQTIQSAKSSKLVSNISSYAWIGKEPSTFALLRDKLIVPKDVICSNSQYECMVEEFPLPTHAIARIGFVPVLLPLQQIKVNGVFVGADTELALKEFALVRVREETEGDNTYLVATEASRNYLWNGILRDLTGVVVTLPKPVGIIRVRNTNIEVSFEMCHLRDQDQRSRLMKSSRRQYLSKINDMKDMVKLGTEVRFTAFKANGIPAPYRAIEVRLK